MFNRLLFVTTKNNVTPSFILFSSMKRDKIDKTMFEGAALKHLQKTKFKNIDFKYPPLMEQESIVAKIDAAFAEIDKSIEVDKKQISAFIALEHMLVERLVTSADVDTETSKISDLLDLIITGPFGGSLHKADYVEEGIPVINPQNISAGRLVSDKANVCSKANSLSKYIMS